MARKKKCCKTPDVVTDMGHTFCKACCRLLDEIGKDGKVKSLKRAKAKKDREAQEEDESNGNGHSPM